MHSHSENVDATEDEAAATWRDDVAAQLPEGANRASAAGTAVTSEEEAPASATETSAASAEHGVEETPCPSGEAEAPVGYPVVAEIRANALALAAIEAQQLRLVAQLADQVEADAIAMLASLPRVPGAPKDHEVIESAVVGEMQAVLGIAQSPAGRLVNLAQRLTQVLPEGLGGVGVGPA